MTIKNFSGMALVLLSVFIFSQSLHAEYLFTAPPREDKASGEKLYGPIAEKLSEILDQKVVYERAPNWAAYAKKMREGRYDIVFDGPHFVGWRNRHLDHTPVVKLPGELVFYVVTHKDEKRINNTRQLIGKKICGMPSPHLATDMVYALFSNPVLQPSIYDVKGGQKAAFKAFKQHLCDATIFRGDLYIKIPQSERDQLKIVAKTTPLPNQTFSISKRLLSSRAKIEAFFQSDEGKAAADSLLNRFSKHKKFFTKAPGSESYAAAADILEGVVFGW